MRLAGRISWKEEPALPARLTGSNPAPPETEPQYSQPRAWSRVRSAPPSLTRNAPWRKVLLRWIERSPKMTLGEVWRRMGISKSGRRNGLRRCPDLRLSIASQMAAAVEAPLGLFLEELAREQGIPALHQRVTFKGSSTAAEPFVKPPNKCSNCGQRGHKRTTCKAVPSAAALIHSAEERVLAERAVLAPRRRKKG